MRKRLLLIALISALLVACGIDQPLRVASAYTSRELCGQVFVNGQAEDQAYQQRVAALPGLSTADPLLSYRVDRPQQQVEARLLGLYHSKSVYHPDWGCMLVRDEQDEAAYRQWPDWPSSTLAPESALTLTPSASLQHALDDAFAERDQAPYKHTQAIVIMQNGQIIAERYAPGFGPDSRFHGFSLSKSVTNALIGILVREGKLHVGEALTSLWPDPADPRHALTIDHLLRQDSGLDMAQTFSGYDTDSRLTYLERDTAAYAASRPLLQPPGSTWTYSDGHFALLSRLIRDQAGGTPAAVRQFAEQQLFHPIGMQRALMEFDLTGTPLGANSFHASARDWARFGQLYLNDGVINGQRILPEGWVAYSTHRTLNTGYAAGFWLQQGEGDAPWGMPWGMTHAPADTFFGMGFMGQFVVVIPSRQLVIVKLGAAHHPDGLLPGMDRLVAAVVGSLNPPQP